jgi:hypothetical protein
MGYHVRPSGRLHLPIGDDESAVAAVKTAWEHHGVRYADGSAPSGALVDIAEDAAAFVTRDGDWLEFEYDEGGDPKWSMLATAFYVAIAPFVRAGTIEIEGEDGATWSYRYADGQITQQGWNGWDGSIEPFGEAVDMPETHSGEPTGSRHYGWLYSASPAESSSTAAPARPSPRCSRRSAATSDPP